MLFMNRYEIADAEHRCATHPILGPASATLASLMEWADANGDGWCYWPKPCRAAARLQAMILADQRGEPEPTIRELSAALRPIKAFRTRQGANFPIYECEAF